MNPSALCGFNKAVSNSIRLGWIPPHPKPVYYGEEMEDYRQWSTGEKERLYGKWGTSSEPLEATFSLEGSFDSDDVSDYYLTPIELGYGKLIDFNHEFVGKDSLREELNNPKRTLVSLMWDNEDVGRVQSSILGEGPNYKYMDNFPRIGWARQAYDKVVSDGSLVGISHGRCFEWDVRNIVSLCRIDIEYSKPGTEVSVVWGEPKGSSPNQTIENHKQTEISATVEPAPYGPLENSSKE